MDGIEMKKYRITKHFVNAYTLILEASSLEHAEEIYDDTDLDQMEENYLGTIDKSYVDDVEEI